MVKLCAFADESSPTLEGQINALKRNGISLIEVRTINGKNVADFTIEEAKNYKKAFEENGISVWSLGSPLGKVDISVDFNDYTNILRHVCELANVFNSKYIRIFSFFNAYDKEDVVYDYLNKMVEISNEYGVKLCHENEKEIFGDTAERVLKIANNVKGLNFIYDPANYLQCGETADKTLELFHKSSVYFHIKDVIVDTDELVPAGCGDGKISKLIELIDDDKVLTLEPHLALFQAFKSFDNTEMKHKYKFKSTEEAFDFAVISLKNLLKDAGYIENKGEFIK